MFEEVVFAVLFAVSAVGAADFLVKLFGALAGLRPVFMDKSDSTRPGPTLFIGHVVASASPPEWLHRTLPTQSGPKPPAGPGWIHEIKHDGFRLMARRDPAGVRLFTRRGLDWTGRYPSIAAAVAALSCRSCLIDGEVVICGEDGIPVFDRLRTAVIPNLRPCCTRSTLLELGGKDLRRTPLEERKAALAKLLRKSSWALQLNEHIAESGDVVFRHACKLGFEGIVSKRLGSPYRSGRLSRLDQEQESRGASGQA